jgi:hypothetical protein
MPSFVLQTDGLDALADALIAELAGGSLDIYDSGFSTLLVSIPLATPIGTKSGGVITLDTTNMNANAESFGGPLTAAEAKLMKSDGTTEVARADVGLSGASINLQNTSINDGQNVNITSAQITVPAGT